MADAHGRVDVLVCNAAVNRTPGDGRDLKDERVRRGEHPDHVVDMGDDGWARMLEVTLFGVFYCCRAALRMMNTAFRTRSAARSMPMVRGRCPRQNQVSPMLSPT